jgi:hypothetical protein
MKIFLKLNHLPENERKREPKFINIKIGDKVFIDATKNFCSGGEVVVTKIEPDCFWTGNGLTDKWDFYGNSLSGIEGYAYYVSYLIK